MLMGPENELNDPAVLSWRWSQPSIEQLIKPYIDPHVNRRRRLLLVPLNKVCTALLNTDKAEI
jgi:hypothetical protein